MSRCEHDDTEWWDCTECRSEHAHDKVVARLARALGLDPETATVEGYEKRIRFLLKVAEMEDI